MMRLLLLLLLLALTCANARASDDTSGFVYDQRLGNQLPLAARFHDQQDKPVTLGQMLEHRPAIMVMGAFHCPGLCESVRDELMNALSRLEDSVGYSLVVVSIDPSDTPADARSALTEDAARTPHPGEVANWHYLTGSLPEIGAVAEAVGFRWRYDPAHKQFLHPSGLVFLNSDGGVSSYLLGLSYRPGDVVLGLRRAAGDIPTGVLPVLLMRFNPGRPAGRLARSAVRLLQLGTATVVLVIAVMMTLALHRET